MFTQQKLTEMAHEVLGDAQEKFRGMGLTFIVTAVQLENGSAATASTMDPEMVKTIFIQHMLTSLRERMPYADSDEVTITEH